MGSKQDRPSGAATAPTERPTGLLLRPGGEGAGERTVSGWAFFHRQNGATAIGVDDRDVEPGTLFEELHVVLHLGVHRGQPDEENPSVTLTASPESGVPRACSACFIRMPGTLAMPPPGKSAGRLNTISIVWLAATALSVLRRRDHVTVILRSGISTSARNAGSGSNPEAGDTVSVRQMAEPT